MMVINECSFGIDSLININNNSNITAKIKKVIVHLILCQPLKERHDFIKEKPQKSN